LGVLIACKRKRSGIIRVITIIRYCTEKENGCWREYYNQKESDKILIEIIFWGNDQKYFFKVSPLCFKQ
jgi:hypothetical protein